MPAANISTDDRVSSGTLVLAALPILLLLGLTGALRWPGALDRRVGPGLRPARTPTGAIILPAPDGGSGNGNGKGEAPSAEAPTEEVAALAASDPASRDEA